MRLREYQGDVVEPNAYRVLYHLCDSHSFAYTMETNTLKSRSATISTTWDETMNHVVGRNHLAFKFVLDADPIISRYGAHRFDDHGWVGNERVSHNEREIRIETSEIPNIRKYLLGVVILFDLFSERGIQWLLYRNDEQSRGFMTPEMGGAKRAIDYVMDQERLGIPLWLGRVGNDLTSDQRDYLVKIKEISDRNLDFKTSLELVADIAPIRNHWGVITDRDTYRREHLAPTIVKVLNGFYEKKRIREIEPQDIRDLMMRIMSILQIGDNFAHHVLGIIDQSGLFNPQTPPVAWGSIIKAIMRLDEDEITSLCQHFSERHKREQHDPDGRHTATMFGRM